MSPKAEPESRELENFLLDNAMHMELGSAEGDAVGRKKVWEWVIRWASPLIGLSMLACSLAVMIYWKVNEGTLHSVLEAVFVAGVITCTVDPFLKRRMQKEVAQDVFHHLLGVDFPVDIRNAFQKALFGFDTYRKDTEIEVTGRKLSDQSVMLEISIRWVVVAARNTEYYQELSFEEAEQGRVLEAEITVERNKQDSYSIFNPPVTPIPGEQMVYRWKSNKEIQIKKKQEVRAFLRYTTIRGLRDFTTFNFSVPAIDPRVRINPCDDLEITATNPDQKNGSEYLYKKVFLPADHIQIRWKPKEPAPGPQR